MRLRNFGRRLVLRNNREGSILEAMDGISDGKMRLFGSEIKGKQRSWPRAVTSS